MTRARARSTTVLLAGLVLVAAGGSSAVLLLPEPTPAGAEPVTAPTAWPATVTSFTDERTVQATPVMTTGLVAAVGTSGTVTALGCEPGGSVVSGSSPVTVDDRPLIALATEVPLWRDLAAGARGADVAALQGELSRLGHPVDEDGRYGTTTRAAVAALQESIGVVRPSGDLALASVVWLAAPEMTVGTCPVRVGDTVGPGSAVAESGPTLTALRFLVPADLVPGERVITVAGQAATVGEAGAGAVVLVTDDALLAVVAESPELALAQSAAAGSGTVAVRLALVAPLDLLTVPPTALADLQGTQGCLVVEGTVLRITVVASSLGTTMVQLPDRDASPPSTVDAPPDGTTC